MLTEKEFKERTSYQMTYAQYKACQCSECDKKETCNHKGAYRRLPEVDGGLGLCPNLKKIDI